MNARVIIRYVVGFLGIFEFLMTGRLLVQATEGLKKVFPMYPLDYLLSPAKYVLIMFTFYLGLIRFMWATTAGEMEEGKGFWLWLGVVACQVSETLFFWTIATLPHFNKDKDPLIPLVTKMLQGKAGMPEGRALLVIVMIITAAVIFHGPQ